MQQHIGIAVAHQLLVVWDLDTAQPQRATGRQPVPVLTDANPCRQRRTIPREKSCKAIVHNGLDRREYSRRWGQPQRGPVPRSWALAQRPHGRPTRPLQSRLPLVYNTLFVVLGTGFADWL